MPGPRTSPPPKVPFRGSARRPVPPSPESGRHRFLEWDDYRVDREWKRFEGTPLRDLYRQLRERFLERHRPSTAGRALEVGPGPGRFTSLVGGPADRIIVLEMSQAMLRRLRESREEEGRPPSLVQGDAVYPPFRTGTFHQVALMGNVLGFAEGDAAPLLARMAGLVEPGGRLLVEFVCGPGERSRYLHRLPTGAIARLLAAPVRAVEPRVLREGFEPVPHARDRETAFRKFSVLEVEAQLRSEGFDFREVLAVAPCLGNDAARLASPRESPAAWAHLLDLEESIGRRPDRMRSAAAVLMAAERVPLRSGSAPVRTIK